MDQHANRAIDKPGLAKVYEDFLLNSIGRYTAATSRAVKLEFTWYDSVALQFPSAEELASIDVLMLSGGSG